MRIFTYQYPYIVEKIQLQLIWSDAFEISKQTILINIVSDYELMLHYHRLLSSHFIYFRVICLFPIFFVWADNITLPINLLRLTYSRNERVICIYLMVETKYIKTQITLLLHLSKGQKEIIIKLHICWCASLFCMAYCCLRGIIH